MTFLYENLITALLPSHPFMLVHNSTSSEVQVFFYITCFNQDKSLFLLFKTNYITNSNGKFFKLLKSTRPVPVEMQQKHRQHKNMAGNSSKLTRKT